MTERRVFILSHAEARRRAVSAVQEAPVGFAVDVRPRGRSLDQNAAQWPYLQAFSDQLLWPVNGAMTKLDPEEWKDLLSAAFDQETTRVAQGINGGVVMLGRRTSKFTKAQFSEYIEFLKATAADRSVNVYEGDNPT